MAEGFPQAFVLAGMKPLHILLKLINQINGGCGKLLSGPLLRFTIRLYFLREGITDQLPAYFIRDAGMHKRNHCALVLIPEHHMDVRMTPLIVVGGHPL